MNFFFVISYMSWNTVLNNWLNGNYYKYPKKIKNKFMWNTSVIKNNGNSKFIEEFMVNDKLPIQQNFDSFESHIKKSQNKYVTSFYNLNKINKLLNYTLTSKNSMNF